MINRCQRQRKGRNKNKYNHKLQTTEYWVCIIYGDQTLALDDTAFFKKMIFFE